MHESLKRLRKALDENLMLPEDTPANVWLATMDPVGAATEEIVRTVANGETAPIAELRELKETFWERAQEIGRRFIKFRYLLRNYVDQAMERVTFIELSRGEMAGRVDGQCDCAVWRAVANGHGLSVEPSFHVSRVIEEVDDLDECYQVHECGCCGARWRVDFNPDSDPSLTRWWAQ